MSLENMTILIVEDDENISAQYYSVCQKALDDIGIQNVVIRQAFTYQQAKEYFDNDEVCFLSVDLALNQSEEKYTNEEERITKGDPGGIRLLKQLHYKSPAPVTVVASGENLFSYIQEALQKFGVFAYYKKSTPYIKDYYHAVKAALLYRLSYSILSDIESNNDRPDSLGDAKSYFEQAIEEAVNAGSSERLLPTDLRTKISTIMQEMDVDIKLPAHQWTERVLHNIFAEKAGFILQARIGNYSAFANLHQSQVDPLLFFVANLLKEKLAEHEIKVNFMGLWRTEVIGLSVLAITNSENKLTPVTDKIYSTFKEYANRFTHNQSIITTGSTNQDLNPTLVIRSWEIQSFNDWHELVDSLGNPAMQ